MPIEYQIDVDPHKLRAYNVTLGELYSAVARANSSVGGKVIQKGNAEYHRPRRGLDRKHRATSRRSSSRPTARTARRSACRNLGTVSRGGEFRRSVLEKNGNEAVGAVVMMRHGENPWQSPSGSRTRSRSFSRACPRASASCPSTTARG